MAGRGWAGLKDERVQKTLGCKRDLQLARRAHSPHQSKDMPLIQAR